jgi:hypothetical protein
MGVGEEVEVAVGSGVRVEVGAGDEVLEGVGGGRVAGKLEGVAVRVATGIGAAVGGCAVQAASRAKTVRHRPRWVRDFIFPFF